MAVGNSFDGGSPVISEDAARATDKALRARVAARDGKSAPGTAPGTPPPAPPAVAKDKVSQLVGGYMVGPSLAPIKAEIEVPLLMQAVRTVLADGKPLLSEAEEKTVLTAFSDRMRKKIEAEAAAAGDKNRVAGAEFLAKNKAVKGVFTTPSGLQYMVLRAGSGARPKPGDRVRVNYKGSLLDGTVFDSSYDRGQPADFGLNQVIQGWSEGVAMMNVGAKFRFWIPAELAYGPKGAPPSIGPNATLTFDVELVEIL